MAQCATESKNFHLFLFSTARMARGTNLLFIVLAFSAVCQVSKARLVSPCDETQELFGDVNLTKAFEESDLVALAGWNNTQRVFKTYKPYNYKDVKVPEVIVVEGYNSSSRGDSHNVAIFLTKTQESSFKLYSQNDEEVKPLKLEKNQQKPFFNCVNYLSLEDQEPQIEVENYLQKAWGSQEGKYYIENGTKVTLKCNGRTRILKNNSKWVNPSGISANDKFHSFEAHEEGNYTCGFFMDDRKSRLTSVALEALGENSIMLELAADNSTLEVHDQGDDTEEMEWRINFLAYPKNITFSWEHNGRTLNFNCSEVKEGKRHIKCNYQEGTLTLKLERPSVLEAGTHSLMVSVWKNGTSLRQKTLQRCLVVWDHELDINLSLETLEGKDIPKDHILEKDQQFRLKCYVTGHPVSDVLLEFRSCDSLENCSSPNPVNGKVLMKSSNLTSTVGPKLRIWQESAQVQGIYQCLGTNQSGEKFLSNHVILAISDCGQMTPISIEAEINVEESEHPVYVNSSSPVISVIIGDDVTLKCRKNKMSNLTDKLKWISQDFSFDQENITSKQEEFSEVLVWQLDPDLLKYNGTIISCGSGGKRQIIVKDNELDINLSLETLEGKDIPKDHILEKDQQFRLKCYVTGHPVSDVLLEFRSCDSLENCSSPNPVNGKVLMKSSNLTSTVGPKLRIWQESAQVQGIYQCLGTNQCGEKFLSNHVILAISDCGQMTPISIEAEINVEESEHPVYVNSSSPVISVIIGDDVTLKCRKNKMSNLTDKLKWISQDFSFDQENITSKQEEFSEVLVWQLDPDLLKYNGTIISCGSGGKREIIVKEAEAPHFVKHESFKSTVERIGSLTPRTTVNFTCKATGVPNPIINWTKDDMPLKNDPPHVTIEGSTLKLYLIDERDSGVYKCNVSNRAGSEHDSVKLTVDTRHQPSAWIFLLSICLCFIVLFFGSVAYYVRKKRKRSIFMIEEVEQFISGTPSRFNPELGFSQQAHLLPYERKFEIARQRIEFGKLIGEGEFGHVFQAKVDGLLPNERQTTVAVKTSKSRSNDVFRKELIAEVKIMMHIGRHANILNLLGVCSENLATKGELLVLVEYCHHGNLRDYLVRHRKNFVQDRDASSHCRHSYGKAASTVYAELRKDDALSSHDTSSVVESHINKERSLNVDSSSAIIASTLNTLELRFQEPSNPLFTSGAFDPASSSDPEPSIYSDGMTQENLAPANLVSWSYQIAKGMEYLSLRKVVHGDLAARNILLDESYTVKISDFGFAKDVYHKNYKKKGQTSCLMPVKWMSPEYLRDEIRSIQSDIWAYGVLLWEIFSLGESPYQGFFIDETFVEKIENGYRLPCPKYSPEKVYKMMLDCWQIEPMDRPPFSDLVKRMIRLLSSREREYFESMNQPYDEQIMSTFLASLITPNYVNLTSTQKRNPSLDLDPEVLSVTYTHVSAPQTSSPMTKRTNLSIASISSD